MVAAAMGAPSLQGAAEDPLEPRLLALLPQQRAAFGERPLLGSHNLAHSALFSDAALAALIDVYPRHMLHALTMGTDPTRSDQNGLARHEGVCGLDLLRAVRDGRLWLNLTRVDRADQRYRVLIDQLYAQLTQQMPDFRPDFCQGNLLISSPSALVHYHADGPASVLWHFRGRKRVWVYPASDERFVSTEALEDIFAGVRHEYLPFEPAFDSAASVFDLEPGEWVAWAQNAPHRISNLGGLNVSLDTEHFTPQSRQRARVYVANRFLRMRFGLTGLSLRPQGTGAVMKSLAHGVARRLGLDPRRIKRHTASSQVDSNAPGGTVPLPPGAASDRASA